MKKFKLIALILAAALALTACAGVPSSDITGTYEGTDKTYIFAANGTVTVEDGGEVSYGTYESKDGKLVIQIDGKSESYAYSYDGTELGLFKNSWIFGPAYTKISDDAPEAPIEVVTEPETEAPTEAPTEKETEAPTEPETEKETEKVTEAPTEKETEEVTEAPTEKETEGEMEMEDPFAELYLGATVYFGEYEQDGDASNGAEPIEWLVYGINGSRAYLISVAGLDARAYNTGNSTSWDNSEIRSWLNGEFLESAFTESERALLEDHECATPVNPYYYTSGGATTWDKVYLLSAEEILTYFTVIRNRIVTPSQYAYNQGASGLRWWLRNTGYNDAYGVVISPDGPLDYYGSLQNDSGMVVRPAIEVTINR